MKLSKWIRSGIFALLLAIPLLHFSFLSYQSHDSHFIFVVRIASSTNGLIQLFYDRGDGYSEDWSVLLPLKASRKLRTYRFALPPGKYKQLRLDPSDTPGEFKISEAKIVTRGRSLIASWLPTAFAAVNHLEVIEQNSTHLTAKSAGAGYDPIILLDRSAITLEPDRSVIYRSLNKSASYLLTFLVAITGAVLFFRWGKLTALRHWLATSLRFPWRSESWIALVALCSVLLSTYPVVFCGRSFVSPLNGPVALLTPGRPFIPGFTGLTHESVRGSDVGATAWEFMPYARAQHKAIFQEKEFPLWNPYNSGGIPLFGQGLSMIGDPLHWLVVLSNSSALAWDFKYVFSKLLFALGVGLGVFAATRSLAASLVVCASCPFVGFFSYRLNHSAYFGLCYSIWILYSWIKIISATTRKDLFRWILILALASFMVMNSGTVKDAYILLIMLHLTGAFCLLLSIPKVGFQKIIQMVFVGIFFVLLTMPFWLTFIYTLKSSFTLSDGEGQPQILDLSRLIGLFDEIFFLRLQETLSFAGAFSANILLGGATVWSILSFFSLRRERLFVGILLNSLIPFSFIFLLPPDVIQSLPGIRNVFHITDTFSCVLLIQAMFLAGFGIRALIHAKFTKIWFLRYFFYLLILITSVTYYFLKEVPALTQFTLSIPPGDFQLYAIIVPLLIALLALPLCTSLLLSFRAQSFPLICLITLLSYFAWVAHGRFGMHLESKSKWYDHLIVNPGLRADFAVESPAIRLLKTVASEPNRTMGAGPVLFPGFQGYYGLEGIIGPDPLMSPYYRRLLEALDFQILGGWTVFADFQDGNGFGKLAPGLDLLNVRYILAFPHTLSERVGFKHIGTHDLGVFERTTAWPRAFFTSNIAGYNEPSELKSIIKDFEGEPLAAIQRTVDSPQNPEIDLLLKSKEAKSIVPATNYSMTTNSATFTVAAPSSGIAVLSTTYYPEAFEVAVNGDPSPYIRVNHAFMGVLLPHKGSYTISFRYYPWYLKLSFVGSMMGVLGFIGLWLVTRGRNDLTPPA